MLNKKNRCRKNNKGYSFVEGIVATFIVTVGMIAIVQLMAANLTISISSRNQVMATFLAQEGVEIVRNIRDNNWAKKMETFDSSNFPSSDKNNCRADLYSTNLLDCSNSNNKNLQKNSSGAYVHSSSFSNTGFKRVISVTYDTGNRNSAGEATIKSAVVWNNHNLPSTIDATHCNLVNQCVFVSISLNKWGGVD